MSQGQYVNANPYTDQMMGSIQNILNSAQSGMRGQMNNLSNYASAANTIGSSYDPTRAYSTFMGQAPAFERLAFGAYSPLQSRLNQQATYQSGVGAQAAAAQLGATGNLNSGAAARAIGQAQALPFAQVQSQLGQQQIAGAMGLMNNSLGQNYGASQFATQAGLQGALGAGGLAGQAANTYGMLLGQGTDMQARLGIPLMTYQQSPWEQFMGGLGNIASLGGTIAGAATGMHLGGLGGGGNIFGGGGPGAQKPAYDPYAVYGGGYSYGGYPIGMPQF